MFVPKPNLTPATDFKELRSFMVEFQGTKDPVVGGIAIFGTAAAYGLVWEYGSSRMKTPGPKTMWGINPLGEEAILTKQAPLGYIAINEDKFWPIIQDEFSKVEFKSKTEGGIRLELEIAMDNASQRIARLVADAAPVDTGDLRSSIQYIDSSKLKEDSE